MERGLVKTKGGENFLLPFILITSLFFLWGFAHSILDVLNKHFQDTMEITRTRSALIQAVVYGGYFLMALPAGSIIRKYGYRTGVITGLVLYAIGALMFIPGGRMNSFEFFLLSLFIIGCGLTCLETAANPYVTVLGDPESSERRINLAQSFNGIGWIAGPLAGGYFLFACNGDITTPYTIIGVVVLIVAMIFIKVKLPEISMEAGDTEVSSSCRSFDNVSIWKKRTFTVGLVSLFLYVAAQTGINSFFINYATENVGIDAHEASVWLSFGGMGMFVAGRMGGSYIMKFMRGETLLGICAAGATLMMLCVIMLDGNIALFSFFLCFLFESIMFPTIFALAIKETGRETKKASSYLIMSIVGGAVAPLVMGAIADNVSMAAGFVVPMLCFIAICVYASVYKKLRFKGARD